MPIQTPPLQAEQQEEQNRGYLYQSRFSSLPPPYLVLVIGQGRGREEVGLMNKKVQTDCLRACSKFISPVIPSAVEGSHYAHENYQGDVSTTLRLLNMTEGAIF